MTVIRDETPNGLGGTTTTTENDRYVSVGVVVVYTCNDTIAAISKSRTVDVEQNMARSSQPNGLPNGIDTGAFSQEITYSLFEGPRNSTYIFFLSEAGEDDCQTSPLGTETIYTISEQFVITAEDHGSPTARTDFTVPSPFGQQC